MNDATKEVANVFTTTDTKPIKIDMNLDIKDIFDVLVTEQEQIIENQITTLKKQSEDFENQIKELDESIDKYMQTFVHEKYSKQIEIINNNLKQLTSAVTIRTEITDGNVLPKHKRPRLAFDPSDESREDVIVLSLSIGNKELDRNTINNAVTFFIESPFDEHMIKLNADMKTLNKQKYDTNKKVTELEQRLEHTDRLLRKAKATLTKKALGDDLETLLADIRAQFPNLQIETK